MKIRSITSFYDPRSPVAEKHLAILAELSEHLRDKIAQNLMPVQSTRLATIPFPYFLDGHSPDELLNQVARMERKSKETGWAYLALGPALPEFPESYNLIPRMLKATENTFFSAIIADEKRFHPQAIKASAEIIKQASVITPDGFTNLRFAALANVPPYAPFLPAAYAQPFDPPAISIAVECADIVLETFREGIPLEESRQALVAKLEIAASEITNYFESLAGDSGVTFKGFDFSPAPFPEDWCSLGGAVEALGLEHIGQFGSLAAVAIIADTLDKGRWQRAGFNGMMLPVLEDSVLSRRVDEGGLTLKDMLLFSAVCGTGLDTIPLSGESTTDELSALLTDVAALAVRLGKPLTARLMPIPGKKAGDRTEFKFDFFSNSRVMALDGKSVKPPLSGNSPISLTPRK